MLLIPSRSAIKQCFLDTPHQCSLWFPQFDQQRRGIWPPKEKREKCTNLNTVKFSSIWKQAHHTTIILGSVWSRNFHPSAQFVLWDGLWVKGGAERRIVNLQEGASCGVVVMAWSKRDMDERPLQGSCEWKFETVSGQRNQGVDGWQREYNQRLCENYGVNPSETICIYKQYKKQKCLAIINDTVLPFWPKFPSVIIRLFWPL